MDVVRFAGYALAVVMAVVGALAYMRGGAGKAALEAQAATIEALRVRVDALEDTITAQGTTIAAQAEHAETLEHEKAMLLDAVRGTDQIKSLHEAEDAHHLETIAALSVLPDRIAVALKEATA